jgi:predicted DNA-binding transcriptional regulator YafY
MPTISRKPTYGAAINFAKIAIALSANPFGVRLKNLERDLEVTPRTIDRYISTLRRNLKGPLGDMMLQLEGSGEQRRLKIRQPEHHPDSSLYLAAAMYFDLMVLRFLEGTVLKDTVADLWSRLYGKLNAVQQAQVRDFDRKFYAVPYAPKDYRDQDTELDLIFRALLQGCRLRIEYTPISGAPREHHFEPYTLVGYRGGLYLLGKSNHGAQPIYLAVERIRNVAFDRDSDGNQVRFTLPRRYNPASFIEGTFGIFEGPETKVVIRILSPETEIYLRSRTIHPTQAFVKGRGGESLLEMKVRGTTELKNWILSFGPWIEVLEPRELRAEVAEMLWTGANLYRGGANQAARRPQRPKRKRSR